jgi:predicted nucleic acid-binding protein
MPRAILSNSETGRRSILFAPSFVGFLLDTSAVIRICDGGADPARWLPAYIPDIVLSQLAADPDARHRQKLLQVVLGGAQILRGEEAEPSFGPGIAADDYEGAACYQPGLSLGRQLPLIARTIGRKFEKHWPDGFIVQAALMRGLTLVTADRKQAQVARRFGAAVKFMAPKRPAQP